MSKCVRQLFVAAVAIPMAAIVFLAIFLWGRDISTYVEGYGKPYGIQLKGPVYAHFLPDAHATLERVITPISSQPIQKVEVHVPLLPLLTHLVFSTPLSGVRVQVASFPLGNMMLDASAKLGTHGRDFYGDLHMYNKHGVEFSGHVSSPDMNFEKVTLTKGVLKQKKNGVYDIQSQFDLTKLEGGKLADGSLRLAWQNPGVEAPRLQFQVSSNPQSYLFHIEAPEAAALGIRAHTIKALLDYTKKKPHHLYARSVEAHGKDAKVFWVIVGLLKLALEIFGPIELSSES